MGLKLSDVALAGLLPLKRSRVLPEVLAGLTLAAIAIPEVMGYTKIAGTPVITGLYTLLVPMALFSLLCSSRHLVVGADSATAAILATALAGLATTGSTHYVALAGLIALMVGFLLLAASVARIGFMADFLSRTVLTGFLTGVGIQVALHGLTGMGEIKLPHGTGLQALAQYPQAVSSLNELALAVSVGVLVVVFGLRLIAKSIPGPIVALGLAIFASWYFDLKSRLDVVGNVPGGLPEFELPAIDWSVALVWQLGPTALAMVVVILAQSAATARAYAAKYQEQLDESADIRALGLGNLGAGLSGTFVVNGSPTKSQMVESAGGRSQLAMLTTVLVVLLVLLFFTGLLTNLPQAALSAIVFKIGLDLIDLKGLRRIYKERRPEFWVSLATILVVVFAGVGPGIVLAIVLSLILHTRHGYHPVNVLLTEETSRDWRACPLKSKVQAAPGLMIYRFTHSMYYANAEQLSHEIRWLTASGPTDLKDFCIDFSCVDDIDFTALETLKALQSDLGERRIELLFAHMLDDPASRSRRQLIDAFGSSAVFGTIDELLDHVKASPGSAPKASPTS
ncbi:SulP family inorganic anion transporter [Roseibium sp. HPY-6]|uniref:SulP family inorganic anion transporter n=1 Tax=Roseibium sp. HPY-6 TaxID=3229852 RepID=UPI00339047FC